MLRFIFGRAHSGKTTTVLNRIKTELDGGNKDIVLIVPEQSSFDYERKLLRILGDGRYTSVPVLSFTRLIDEVGRLCGGIAGKRLSDCGRTVLMSRAVSSVTDELSLLGKYSANTKFIESVIDTVNEFKRCGIDSADIKNCADTLPKGILSAKLRDIALVTDAYDGIIKNEYVDPCDDMMHLEKQLSQYAYFSEKTVYIDAFKNFTGAQIKILEQVIRQADDVTFSFCFDEHLSNDAALFSNVGATVRKLVSVAEKYGVDIDKPTVLNKPHFTTEELCALERCLSLGSTDVYEHDANSVTVCAADSIYDEAEFVANEIRRLVRTEGYRYRDFVIIARSEDTYRSAVEHMCRRYEIPCFTDKRYGIAYLPLSVFLRSAINASFSFSTDEILKYLKTELAGLSLDEINMLENYVYIWKIDRADWKKEWTMSPSGFDKFDDTDIKQLKTLNDLRTRAISPILSLKSSFNGSAEAMATAIWKLMTDCSVADRLAALIDELPPDDAELNRQSYDAVINILDSLCDTLGTAECTPRMFSEYFELALSQAEVGTIPQMLDEVTFGAADRIKPRDPKIVFAVGMNQGVFPASAACGGIIGSSERSRLLRLGLPITDYTLGFSIDEKYLIYTTLCCASDRVYVSYSASDSAGKPAKPSSVVENILSLFPKCHTLTYGKDSFTADRVETAGAAYTGFMRNFGNTALCNALSDVFGSIPLYSERIRSAKRYKQNLQPTLSCETSERLFGKNMCLSATGIDTYFRCSFSYFCRYGLHVKVIKPAEIDVLQRGTIVHEVLEKLITEKGAGVSALTDDEIREKTDLIVEEYLARIQGIDQICDNRFMYLVSCIKSLTVEVVCHIRDEFAQSGFVPVFCELKIGGADGDIEEAVIPAPDGGRITLRGAIDRVDSFGAYIRVVDYKTGARKFCLPDVLFGLNMQMLLYLYAALSSKRFSDCVPAGVLYLEASKHLGEDNNFCMNGLLRDDKEVIEAMDAENSGKYIPRLRYKKDGTPYKNKDYINGELFSDIFAHMEKLLVKMNMSLRAGEISVDPTDGLDKDACKYCDYAAVCGIENRAHNKVLRLDGEALEKAFKEGGYNV